MNGDIYKDHYQFEWDHRSHLTSALNVPIAVATVIGGALAVMVQGFNYQNDSPTYFFVGFSALSAISIVVAVFFLFRALHGYQYQRVPTPAVLKNYYDRLVQWHESNNSDKPTAEREFEAYFHQRIAEAVENNATNNKRKSGYLYRTNLTLAIAMLFVGLSSVPFLIKTVTTGDKIYSIRVLQMPAVNSVLNKEVNPMSSNQDEQRHQTTVQQPVVSPPKPPPPPNEFIKEHTIPPSTTEKIIHERKE
jgi:hypothetical protein